jgi:molybdopterin-containing oxidoreductase family iron-sulfur binding subunit
MSVRAVARDLARTRGASAVLVGDRQPACVHAAAHALNTVLGNVGRTLRYGASPIRRAGAAAHESLAALASALEARSVESLIILESDIVGAAPADLALSKHLRAAKSSFCLSSASHSTARACEWHVPAAHWLESWADACSLDGTASVVQPLIAPLYGGHTASELLGLLLGESAPSAHAQVRALVSARYLSTEAEWERALSRGTLEGSALASVEPRTLRWEWLNDLCALEPAPASALELSLVPDSRLYDGRFADNPWLLELPDPITKLTWSNAALVAAATARRLGLKSGDAVRVKTQGASVDAGLLVVPGQAENCVALQLGWGEPHTLAEAGANAFSLATSERPWFTRVRLEPTLARAELAITQAEMGLEELQGSIALHATLAEYQREPSFAKPKRKKQLSLYPPPKARSTRQWGMVIDLNVCTGCSACVLACQSENNIPTVGRAGVLKQRQMHWLRIDRYRTASGVTLLQPMACQHCETAPCEYVCPTGATVHSADGLNQMVYNRCVGTRFCSNNCPYKVRRFNWFNYHSSEGPSVELARNPEVTVRERGVMEKCTYCVQRIRKAEIAARISEQPLRDGDVVTACEQACPTGAIVFGDVAEPTSRVHGLREHPLAFEVLNELGTAPRTRYLAKLSNPNPELT